MSHYLILKIVSRKLKILIVIINLSPFGVYVFFLTVYVLFCLFWGGRGGRGFSSVGSEVSINKVTFLHFTLLCSHFLIWMLKLFKNTSLKSNPHLWHKHKHTYEPKFRCHVQIQKQKVPALLMLMPKFNILFTHKVLCFCQVCT